jgi:hypothetical protein
MEGIFEEQSVREQYQNGSSGKQGGKERTGCIWLRKGSSDELL